MSFSIFKMSFTIFKMSFTIFKMSCSLLGWVFVVVKWVENEFLIVQSCIYKNVCIFCGFRFANQVKYWLTLTKNPAKMSFRLIEMSFTIFKMSLATFKMSFGVFFKMSFSQNARKKSLHCHFDSYRWNFLKTSSIRP